MAVLRHHNERLSKLRDAAERRAEQELAPPALELVYERVYRNLPKCRNSRRRREKPRSGVKIARKWPAADGIAAFQPRPLAG